MTKEYNQAWRVIASQIEAYRANEALDIDAIDNAVSNFGDFVWEIGPYLDTSDLAFSLSPGWSAELLKLSEEVIKTSPELKGVVFTEAKPPKDWDRRFSLRTDDGPVDVDCRRIGFQLARRADDNAELSVRLETRFDRWKWDIVNIWVDSEIGERNKIVKIVNCEIHMCEQSTNVEWGLREMFFSIFPDAAFAKDAERMTRTRDLKTCNSGDTILN